MLQERRQEQQVRGHLAATVCAFAVAAVVTWPSPASAQEQECRGETVTLCGFVWNDTNGNGIQDVGENGIPEVKVQLSDGMDLVAEAYTDSTGAYQLDGPVGTFTLFIATSTVGVGAAASPTDATGDDFDSDGTDDTFGNSIVVVTIEDGFSKQDFDFGFTTTPVQQPGTGTPGYWKNHPGAWPVPTIVVGGIEYTKAEALFWLGKVGKDKTTTMFSSLVPAMLNVKIGNRSDCIASTIALADAWMETYGPVGSGIMASTPAWAADGEILHRQMDSYNNGQLCAPHRK
jgi:hypothetical protein